MLKMNLPLLLAGAIFFLPTLSFAGSNSYSIGVEGFRDLYREPDLNLTDRANYGSITGYYSRSNGKTFLALDARGSYGKDDYQSPSGNLSGVPQWEFDARARFGITRPLWGGALSPYIGIGMRYFRDEGKGYVTDLNAAAYDRRILQTYIPIGASLAYQMEDGWTVTPQAEADFMFYGNVDSRLTNVGPVNVPGFGIGQFNDPANNTQHFGIGGRSELMFGKSMGNYSFQAGPFIRYWYVNKSDTQTYLDNSNNPVIDVYEPKNNRTQVGIAARVIW